MKLQELLYYDEAKKVLRKVLEKLKLITSEMFDKYTLDRWYDSIDDDVDETFEDLNVNKRDAMDYFREWLANDKDHKASALVGDFVNDTINAGYDEIDYDELIRELAEEWEFDDDIHDEVNFEHFVQFVKDEYLSRQDDRVLSPWADEYERGYARRDM